MLKSSISAWAALARELERILSFNNSSLVSLNLFIYLKENIWNSRDQFLFDSKRVSDTNLAFRSQLFILALDSSLSSWLTSFVYLYEMSAISAFFLRNASYTALSLLRAASAASAAAASALELATAAATVEAPP